MSNISWRIGKRELEYIKKALDSGLSGNMNRKFEEEFAKKFGVKYAIGVNSGTSALHCCYAAMNIGPDDEIIVPPLTFGSPAFAALYQGAVPVFADVDPEMFTIDPEDVARKVTSRTKAIVTVALYGLSPDMDPILQTAGSHHIFVIEDCAQCFLGKYKGKTAGTLGDMAIFSFERSKHMTTGNGGAIITNDEKLAENARRFSILGYSTLRAGLYESKPSKEVIQDPNFIRHLFVAPNYRFPELCAAMALAQLEGLDRFVKMRIDIAELYSDVIKDCDWLTSQKTPDGYVNSYWTYVMKLEDNDRNITWKDFRKTFLSEGGDPFYAAWALTYMEPALSGIEFMNHQTKYKKGLCPVAEDLQPRLIQLKTNYGTIEKAKEQASALKRTIRKLS